MPLLLWYITEERIYRKGNNNEKIKKVIVLQHHALKMYWENGGNIPRNLHLWTRWTSILCSLLGEKTPVAISENCGSTQGPGRKLQRIKILLPLPEIKLGFLNRFSCSLVTIPTDCAARIQSERHMKTI
jgi:hypothetical protein